jgi:hypothetical protein
VAKLASEGGAPEVETSLERLRPTSCLIGNAEKQKSVCGKCCQWQRQHWRVHFIESVRRSVPILAQGALQTTTAPAFLVINFLVIHNQGG